MQRQQSGYSRRNVLKKSAVISSGLIVGGVAATGTAAAGIGDGRVGHYHLNNLHLNKDTEQKVKNHVHDASPAKNHGVNDGAEVVKDGAVGNAFAFDGDAIIDLGASPSLTTLDTFTVTAWVRPDTTNYERWARVFAIGGEENAINIGRHRRNERPFVHFIDSNDGGNVVSAGTFTDGTWTHIAGTWNESQLVLYQDGTIVADADLSGKSVTAYESKSWIGDRPQGNNPNGWAGRIDDARIYNRALTSAEIQDLADIDDD